MGLTTFQRDCAASELIAIFKVFRPAGATDLTDVNKIWQDEGV